jgi:hypothetical protein
MDINELDKLYWRWLRGELKDDFSTSTLIIAQKVRIEELEEELQSSARGIVMRNVVAGENGINISGVRVGRL